MPAEAETVTLAVEGMTCTNCALGITRTLEKKGLKDISVNFSTGEASFRLGNETELSSIIQDINSLGYKASLPLADKKETRFSSLEKKFFLSLVFTIPLFAHMFFKEGLLHNPWVQLALCIPVFIIGTLHFGKSAWASIKTGIPNMDVLIAIGSTAAFFYSLAGTILYAGQAHQYLFYETAASIITLVLLGNVLEHRSVRQTSSAIRELGKMQVNNAKKIVSHNGHEHFQEVDISLITPGDVIAVNSGDRIPADCTVISGNATLDESMISGESLPVEKSQHETVIGGTIVLNGNLRLMVQKTGKQTLLSQIIEMVKNAQQNKPAIQKLGDKVSAIFVPVVLAISLLTFVVSAFVLHIPVQKALMNAIAVLVISCPCAMGLATPTAVMVGIGRAAKNGILIKGGQTLEQLASVRTIVFDKTGTLTTGDFEISSIKTYGNSSEEEIKSILYAIENHSSHPIAVSIVKQLKVYAGAFKLSSVKEEKGMGMQATDEKGNTYTLGSPKNLPGLDTTFHHDICLIKNNALIAGLNIKDHLKTNASELIQSLKRDGIKPVLLSGDRKSKCDELARKTGIEDVFSEQTPAQKIEKIEQLIKSNPTAMVGDGINDAPALAKATVGISLGNATQVAIQSAQVIVLNGNDLAKIQEAIHISKHTLITIKQNLFWAFFYNVVAIPIAAAGFLSPMIGALAMALSDVVVVGNSLRLKVKNIKTGK